MIVQGNRRQTGVCCGVKGRVVKGSEVEDRRERKILIPTFGRSKKVGSLLLKKYSTWKLITLSQREEADSSVDYLRIGGL